MGRLEERQADRALAHGLVARTDEGRVVHKLDPPPEDWRPEPAECHRNVDRWVELHDGWYAARGWVVDWVGSAGEVTFAAHSVAADPEGKLWEVTKMNDRERFLIPHPGALDEFVKNVATKRWVTISTM